MRIAVLWGGLSGYLNACLRELAGRPGVELFVAHTAVSELAPFDENLFSWMKDEVVWRDDHDFERLRSRLNAFDPEVVMVAGWHVPMYRRIVKPLKNRCLRIMAIDNTWNGTLKQWLGILISPVYVRSIAEAIWVPGQRQATFARKLGFPVRLILQGLYCCEFPAFAAVHEQRLKSGSPLPTAFLFVGRLVEDKGIRNLLEAYAKYRATAVAPWPLLVCGTGPLRSLLEGKPGVQILGFVQPSELPGVMESAGCLVLPSVFEPWALVVHEATAAGRIVIATENVGAVPHLVQNYYSGFVTKAGDAAGLSTLMAQVSELPPERRERMSRASHELSQQYTPQRWADSLLAFAADHMVGQQE
jgi:glycosyltransferase involved in cell wall biosynthesis